MVLRKVYTKKVIDIATGRTLEQYSYNYDGPWALAVDMFNADQDGWGIYNDGTESGSTLIGAEDTPQTLNTGTTYLLRIRVVETNALAGNLNGKLYEFDINSGGFNNLTTISTGLIVVVSSNLTDGNDTTDRLTGAGGTYDSVNAWVSNLDGTFTNNALAASNEVDALLAVQIVDSEVNNGDTITVRVSGMQSYSNAGIVIDVNKPGASTRRIFVVS